MSEDPISFFGRNCEYSYCSKSILGVGGFGSVYKATITQHGHFDVGELAVKVCKFSMAENWQKWRDRWNTLVRLKHPHLIRYHKISVNEPSKAPVVEYLMDYCSGGDLEMHLSEKKTEVKKNCSSSFDETTAMCYAVQIIKGVRFLHKNSIMHGDLKPANVLVKYRSDILPHLLIGDLDGLIQMENSIASRSIDNLCGTLRYMSPELLKRLVYAEVCSLGRKSDIWSLGCVIHDLVNCCFAIENKVLVKEPDSVEVNSRLTSYTYAAKIIEGYVPLIRATASPLRDIAIKCLQVNSAARESAAGLLKISKSQRLDICNECRVCGRQTASEKHGTDTVGGSTCYTASKPKALSQFQKPGREVENSQVTAVPVASASNAAVHLVSGSINKSKLNPDHTRNETVQMVCQVTVRGGMFNMHATLCCLNVWLSIFLLLMMGFFLPQLLLTSQQFFGESKESFKQHFPISSLPLDFRSQYRNSANLIVPYELLSNKKNIAPADRIPLIQEVIQEENKEPRRRGKRKRCENELGNLTECTKFVIWKIRKMCAQLAKPIKDRDTKVAFINSLKLKIRQTSLIALVGPIGSGRNTFLRLFLKRMELGKSIEHGSVEIMKPGDFLDTIEFRSWTIEEILKVLVLMIYNGIPKDLIVFTTNGVIDLPVVLLQLLGIRSPLIVIMSSNATKLCDAVCSRPKLGFVQLAHGVCMAHQVEDSCLTSGHQFVYNWAAYKKIKNFRLGLPVTHHDDIKLITKMRRDAGIRPFQYIMERLRATLAIGAANDSIVAAALFRYVYIYEKKYQRDSLQFMLHGTLDDFD
ncbi:uncharacterized protein LOC129592741 [Paramacrobiotus metropolitanus]|uniref:uncharacterized protein LOC129592741 n=1 Tax=Paramacrobiotus metropolitanus TaxID=2943436 RepID=UPI00244620A4|nr:uncharacterized protein LOC129592741 [Paramacrobiotus metropolitanus]